MVEQRYGTIKDTAIRYGMTEWALRGRIERRTIDFIKDGKRIRFDWTVLDRKLKKSAVSAGFALPRRPRQPSGSTLGGDQVSAVAGSEIYGELRACGFALRWSAGAPRPLR
jgi:hypothetical protein